jgi:sulfite reductase alpha subunit-like flavoprotein
MEFVDSSVLILFGSETGTAEATAFKLAKELSLRGFPCRTCGTDEYDISLLPSERFCIFIVATAGDGETPMNMRLFWRFLLQRSLGSTSLAALQVAVFGMGDSSYIKFNAAARRLGARLSQLGATHMAPLGLGDDQNAYGYYGALNEWLPAVYTALDKIFPLSCKIKMDEKCQKRPQYAVETLTMPGGDKERHIGDSDSDSGGDGNSNSFYKASKPLLSLLSAPNQLVPLTARLISNERGTADDWHQDVRRLSFELTKYVRSSSSSSLAMATETPGTFQGGDVAVVYPENSPQLVQRALAIVLAGAGSGSGSTQPHYVPTTCIRISRFVNNNGPTGSIRRTRLPSMTCTVLDLVSRFLDFGGVPHRPFFEELAPYATDPEEADKLRELGSPEGTDLYFDYCVREKRSYVECMEEFPSARPPLVILLDLVPIIQPRQFSLASSDVATQTQNNSHNPRVDLCVGLLQRTTPYGRKRTGICSGYLCSLAPGAEIRLWLRQGTFRAPSVGTPLLLVGPGTGVAPMRALLQERMRLLEADAQTKSGTEIEAQVVNEDERNTTAMLFYGCRHVKKDFLYDDEWKSLGYTYAGGANESENDTLLVKTIGKSCLKVQLAFSRMDSDHPYVTHRIRENAEEIWNLLKEGAYVFVAGSANRMPKDVRSAFKDVCMGQGRLQESESEAFLNNMAKQGKYYVEAWS